MPKIVVDYLVALAVLDAVFPVSMALNAGTWNTALLYGALFGFLAYAAYNITNLATLRGWPMAIDLVDLTWGKVATAAATTGAFPAVRAMP